MGKKSSRLIYKYAEYAPPAITTNEWAKECNTLPGSIHQLHLCGNLSIPGFAFPEICFTSLRVLRLETKKITSLSTNMPPNIETFDWTYDPDPDINNQNRFDVQGVGKAILPDQLRHLKLTGPFLLHYWPPALEIFEGRYSIGLPKIRFLGLPQI